jgi:hypothetical protein
MQELGFNKIYKTGNAQIDVLALEIQRAQAAASEAAAKAERAEAGLQRLDSDIRRLGQRTFVTFVVLAVVAVLAGLSIRLLLLR